MYCCYIILVINFTFCYSRINVNSNYDFTTNIDNDNIKITEKFRNHITQQTELRNNNKTDIELYPYPLPIDYLKQFEYLLLDIGGMVPKKDWININAQYDDYLGNVTDEQKKNYIIRNMDNLYVSCMEE